MDPEQARALLGTPGPGRVRYGAAMALWQAGLMPAEELESYRVAAAHDRLILAPAAAPTAAPTAASTAAPAAPEALADLIDAADRYLANLRGPGVAEVRAGIAAGRDTARPGAPRSHPVVAAHLAPALAGLGPTHPTLAAAIAAAAPHLDWRTYDGYPPDQIGPDFALGHAFAPVIIAARPTHDFELGLFLIAPHVFYRDHCHAAPELYAPLTGPHGWRFGPGRPLVYRPAHVPVWNPPHRPHATLVGCQPFLCLYGWTRDVDQPAFLIAADDWPRIEAPIIDPLAPIDSPAPIDALVPD